MTLAHWCGALAMLVTVADAGAESLVSLQTRPGVEQRYLLLEPAQATAAVILFAGGKGALGLSSVLGAPTIAWGKNNFLVRTRELFADHGFMVAVVDAPSDRQSQQGMLGGFRTSAEHVVDIDAVIGDLRQRSKAPVWLIGTSRGTESATHVALRSAERPAGLVLTSSMAVPNTKGTAVTEMDLDRIAVPTLVVAHGADGCNKTPPAGARQIATLLSNAPVVAVKVFEGGDPPRSKPCQARSAHGFLGIEREVIDEIVRFIKDHGH